MAIHWNAHLTDIFDKIQGLHWRDWYTLYVDDLGVHGMTEDQVRTRSEILEVILEVFEKSFSDKTGTDVATDLDIAGLHFTDRGVRLSDEAFDTLAQDPTTAITPAIITIRPHTPPAALSMSTRAAHTPRTRHRAPVLAEPPHRCKPLALLFGVRIPALTPLLMPA